MNFTKSPSFASVAYVVGFKTPDSKVRFKQAEIEAAFAGFVNGQSQQTNVPDQADPTQPRILFGNDTKSIAISQIGCQLQMSFAESELSIERQFDVIRKNVIDFFSRASKLFGNDVFRQSGFVVDVAFPSNAPMADLHQYVVDRFYKGVKLGKIASAQFTIGFELDELFLTISSSVYEQRKIEFTANPFGAPTIIDVNSMVVAEYGLTFKVDVNDRPKQKNSNDLLPTRPEELLDKVDDFFRNKFLDFSGLSLNGV